MCIRIMDRDIEILLELTRWRFLLSRQVRTLCGFSGQRSCDRRLSKLIQAGYIIKKRFIYGIPSLYFVTPKAVRNFDLQFLTSFEQVRIEQIIHDINVVDVAIYLFNKNKINKKHIVTERQIKNLNGFGVNKHNVDFYFTANDERIAVEIELSIKTLTILERNVKDNFMNYDSQIWFYDENKPKLINNLKKLSDKYNMKLIEISEVRNYVSQL